jgi:hypothetical protein
MELFWVVFIFCISFGTVGFACMVAQAIHAYTDLKQGGLNDE